MGILSNIGKAITGAAAKTLDFVSAVVRNPVAAISNPAKATATSAQIRADTASGKMTLGQNIKVSVVPTVVNTAAAAALVVGGAAIAAKGVGTVAKALIPTTTTGKIVAGVAAPIVLGAVVQNPLGAASAVANTPSALANFGANASNLIANPTVDNAKNLVKENPAITGLLAAGAAVAIGGGALAAVSSLANTQATKANTAAIQGGVLGNNDNLPAAATNNAAAGVIPTNTGNPITPATTVISSSSGNSTKKRKRSKSKPTITNISQRVNVQVSNNQATKKYLNVVSR